MFIFCEYMWEDTYIHIFPNLSLIEIVKSHTSVAPCTTPTYILMSEYRPPLNRTRDPWENG